LRGGTFGGSKVSAVTVIYEACARRVDEDWVLAQALDFSGLTFGRRGIGQATLCALCEGMSVGAKGYWGGKGTNLGTQEIHEDKARTQTRRKSMQR
jgi:hypothetical protein